MGTPSDLHLAIHLFLQLIVILAACRVVGWLGKKLGQTQVVSEMVAGVFLGPSLLGVFFPEFQEWLFPKVYDLAGTTIRHPSMSILYVVSQVGLVLYMFLVGIEFDASLLKKRAHGAFFVSISGIAAPFLLGGLLAFAMVREPDFFVRAVTPWQAALFLGAAMCVTAFPMLARIIVERGIAQTSMGTLALSAAAFDDAFAWALLAVVLAQYQGNAMIALLAIGGGTIYAVITLTGVKRIIAGLNGWTEREGRLTPPILTTVLCLLMLGAWITDSIGIYAVFGAFVMGIAMPRGILTERLKHHMELLTVGLLLPLFFVYSGLNTKITLINTWQLVGWALLVCLVASAGKGIACMLAAKATGEPWRESVAIGTLMNARGLMELIMLNIGLEKKVITPTLFTIMVLMAIVTTLMASPLFVWVYGKQAGLRAAPA